MNKQFIQVFDSTYAKELIKKGLKVIKETETFTLLTFDNKLNFDLDMSKVKFNRMMF